MLSIELHAPHMRWLYFRAVSAANHIKAIVLFGKISEISTTIDFRLHQPLLSVISSAHQLTSSHTTSQTTIEGPSNAVPLMRTRSFSRAVNYFSKGPSWRIRVMLVWRTLHHHNVTARSFWVYTAFVLRTKDLEHRRE